ELGGDIVIMVHPDYQYTPLLIPAMTHLIASGLYEVVFASRILGKGALKGGMPMYKYVANRLLTFIQNMIMHQKLSEYHTGYRAFSAKVLKSISLEYNSDDFVFDNQMIAQIFEAGYQIGEITCPTKYFADGSSINFRRSVKYGLGVMQTSFRYRLHRMGLQKDPLFTASPRK
ncbi:MAG TPA: glycosyltransferase family 2 protein, partial [Bacteroidales bacterium]|nr:glycosyltransferase family 2 protein [Bacteroidales bacterium]